METEEQFYISEQARLRQWLPWLYLLRSFRIALGPRKLALGSAAAVLLVAGQRAIDRSPFAPEAVSASEDARVAWPWDDPRLQLDAALEEPGNVLADAASYGKVLLRPFQSVVDPARLLLRLGNTWSDVAYAWTQLFWALTVWALFGTALSRMAILDIVRRGDPGIRESLLYSLHHIRSTFGAPLLPIGFIGVLWLVCCVGGLAGRIPVVGEVLAGALWFVPLLLGLGAAVIMLCIAAGWPLMICTVSVERSDAFDGLSRSYDYLLSRPWYALWLASVALVSGSAAIILVGLVVQFGSHFATWAVGTGMGDGTAVGLTSGGPETLTSELTVSDELVPATSPVGRTLAAVWLQALALLEWGFVYSFFWCAMTLMYVLLRKSVDATPLEHVSCVAEPQAESLPLSGMAAAERREAESEQPS